MKARPTMLAKILNLDIELLADGLGRNADRRQHDKHADDGEQQDGCAIGSPDHDYPPLNPVSLRYRYRSSAAPSVICVTFCRYWPAPIPANLRPGFRLDLGYSLRRCALCGRKRTWAPHTMKDRSNER